MPRAEVSPPGTWPRFWCRGFASRRGRRPGCGGPPPAKAGFSGGSRPRTEASRPNPLAVFRIPLGRGRSAEEPVEPRRGDDAIDDELHRDGREEEAHDAAERPRPGAPDLSEDPVRVVQQHEG